MPLRGVGLLRGSPPLKRTSPLFTSLTASSTESHTFVLLGTGRSVGVLYCLTCSRTTTAYDAKRVRKGAVSRDEHDVLAASIFCKGYSQLGQSRTFLYSGQRVSDG